MTATDIQSSTSEAITQPVQRVLTAIEGEACGGSAELHHQRHALSEFDRHDMRRDAVLARLDKAVQAHPIDRGLVRLLIAEARALDKACDLAIDRVEDRRDAAHHHTKRIASVVETVLTGRTR